MIYHRIICACILPAALGACSGGAPARKSSSGADVQGFRADAAEPEGVLSMPLEHSIDADAKSRVVRELARQVGARYVFSDLAAELEKKLLELLDAGAYDRVTDTREFARALTRDLWQAAKDKHLVVEVGAPERVAVVRHPEVASGIRKLEILPGNIGYLELEGLPPLDSAAAAISGAFALLRNTDALIIDNRGNHGGDPATVVHYVSYLSRGAPFVASRIRFRDDVHVEELRTQDLGARSYGTDRPVFVLDSASTFSGGEDLSYTLQALRRAKIVGEVTAGGAHPTGRVPLDRGLIASIPFARSENPVTGTNWEGVGVVPDVAVSAEHALTEAERLARAAVAEGRERLASGPRQDVRSGVMRARVESPGVSRGPNQVINGDFSRGLAPWAVTRWSGPFARAEHPHRLSGEVLCFSVKPGERILLGWPPEASSHAISLEEGARYQLSFEASASGSVPIAAEVSIGHRLPPYIPAATAEIPLDSSLRSFTVDVDPTESDDQVGLAFKIAAAGDTGETDVCFDDVAVTLR